jgi:predicted hydrocarbon binding protein
MRKLEFPLHYAKGAKLFQIVAHLSDAPGSLSTILEVLRGKVNLIGTASYTLSDDTAMFSAFTEALSPDETVEGLQKVLKASKAIIEADVMEGRNGLLVDTFHTGPRVGVDDYILFMRKGMCGVFDHIVKIFGSGGEVLLYEEGMAMAQRMTQNFMQTFGMDTISGNTDYLSRFLTAQGWGIIDVKQGEAELAFLTTVKDCFECAPGSEVRRKCDFLRGYIDGSAEIVYGVKIRAEETECTLRGAKACVFRLAPA